MTTQKRGRIICRWLHIILGLVLLCYVYSPFSRYPVFNLFVKFLAVPLIILSGLWLWKPPFVSRVTDKVRVLKSFFCSIKT